MFEQTMIRRLRKIYPSFSVQIEFCGHDLTVRGSYSYGERPSSNSPGESTHMDIDSIFIGDYPDCVGELLEPSIKEIEGLVWKELDKL